MEMMHVRAVSPPELTAKVVGLLTANPCVFNVVVPAGGARKPDGAAITCDVLVGAANDLLAGLRRLDLHRRGSIMIELVEMAICGPAAEAESRELGGSAHAPVWDALQSRIDSEARYVPSFFFLLVVAGLIGAVGIITNSQILIVAAMVVGPEYGAITSVASGIDRGSSDAIRRGLLALSGGFLLAVLATFAFALVVHGLTLQSKAFDLGIRPVSNLIDTPNFFSLVVAILAGVVGIVSLTQSRTSALLGVFISVTTIPAAADIGVSCAFASWSEAWGSALQLLLNVVVLIVVGFMTLRLQRRFWRRVSRHEKRAAGR